MRITNINQLLPFIEGKPEFVVIDKGDYLIIDYVYQDTGTFDDPETMECRGIKFDRNGLILARPFRKFFNYGERGAGLPVHRPHFITEKLDGSMIHAVQLERRLFFHTRKGHTDVAKKAERFVISSPQHQYMGFCSYMIGLGYTPIFEYTGPDNRIVLRYEESKMVLLACRHIVEGTLMPYRDVEAHAVAYDVPLVSEKGQVGSPELVSQFVEHTYDLIDAEGYVVHFDDGYMVKIKAKDYVLKHRAMDDLNSKKKVVALCAQGFLDDMLPAFDDADAAEILAFNDELQHEITVLALAAEGLAAPVLSGEMDRKQFALEVLPNVKPKFVAQAAFGVMDGKSARRLIVESVQRNYETLGIKWRGE